MRTVDVNIWVSKGKNKTKQEFRGRWVGMGWGVVYLLCAHLTDQMIYL